MYYAPIAAPTTFHVLTHQIFTTAPLPAIDLTWYCYYPCF